MSSCFPLQDATCLIWNYSGEIVQKFKGHKVCDQFSAVASWRLWIVWDGCGQRMVVDLGWLWMMGSCVQRAVVCGERLWDTIDVSGSVCGWAFVMAHFSSNPPCVESRDSVVQGSL